VCLSLDISPEIIVSPGMRNNDDVVFQPTVGCCTAHQAFLSICSCWRWVINEEGRLPFRPNGHILITYVYFLSATTKKELKKLGHVASVIKGGGIGTG
jgi:hypothetical protein